jgi:hypothetical protein
MPNPESKPETSIERLGATTDIVRLWLSKAWRIGVMMTKGAYLLGERKRLLRKLGEEAYTKLASGEWKSTELDPMVRQLERLTKKVEIEEMLIRGVRFGTKPGRNRGPETETESPPPPETPSPTDTTKETP